MFIILLDNATESHLIANTYCLKGFRLQMYDYFLIKQCFFNILLGECVKKSYFFKGFYILSIILVPLFAEGMSPSESIARLTDSSLKAMSLLRIIIIVGLAFGCICSFVAWIGRRNREREETDELMREYLKKKLFEENEKQD